jgi:hypothetical protein
MASKLWAATAIGERTEAQPTERIPTSAAHVIAAGEALLHWGPFKK